MLPLPRATTPIIGRLVELDTIAACFDRGARWVSITGLGGIGKTRLAVEVGARLQGSIGYCDASGCASLDELAVAVAIALEVELPRMSSLFEALALATSALPTHLIVLDDLEADGARGVAIGRWLEQSPTTRLLVTTRQAYAVPLEAVVALDPLPSGDASSPATELLLRRARQLRPGWGSGDEARVARLAAQLDGLPLVIELAAAHARVAGPAEIERLLLTRPPKTLAEAARAAVAWAWARLDPIAAGALARLAAIEGPFDFALAAATLGVDAATAGERLRALTHASLVAESSEGCRLLDTVRAFALDVAPPTELAAGLAAMADEVLARTCGMLAVPLAPGMREVVSKESTRLDKLVARGLQSTDRRALQVAFAAARVLLAGRFEGLLAAIRTDQIARLCVHLPTDGAGIPLAERVATATATARYIYLWEARVEDWQTFTATAERWIGEANDDEARHELRLFYNQRLGIDLRYRELLPGIDAARAQPGPRGVRRDYIEVLLWMLARRGLGLSDIAGGYDERELARVCARLVHERHADAEGAQINALFLKVQLGREVSFEDAAALVEATRHSHGYGARVSREYARALLERGRIVAAIGHYQAAVEELAAYKRLARDHTETQLELVVTLVEAGRIEAAVALFATTEEWPPGTYWRAFRDAVAQCLAALKGEAHAARFEPCGTIEDAGLAVLAALGTSDLAEVCDAAAHAARFSTRVRQALRIGRAFLGATNGDVLALALDGSAFRRGAAWVPLDGKPRALLGALTAAWFEGRSLDKDALGAALWPGENVPAEQRNNRLHVAMSSLRKLGLGDMLVHDGAGFTLDPKGPLLRLDPRALASH